MVKKLFVILLTTLLMLSPCIAAANPKVIVIQSLMIKPYEDALSGFKSACDCKIERLILSEMGGVDVVKEVSKIKPDIILTVGIDALSKVKKIKDIPIVYIMVPNPQSVISKEENITGVSMNIPPEKQLVLLQEAFHDVNRVGLLYDPEKSGYLVEKARYYSRKLGIKLIVEEVHSSKEVPSIINKMKYGIDVFWMLPDTTVITPETAEFLFLFSLENKIPIFTFSDKYLELGAVMSVGIDAFDIGRQAGEMAKKILSGANIKNLSRDDARKAVLTINLKTAKKLGITINNKIISRAKIIN
jgi:putative ABC transport system substrate-binding protein